jgi:hypothetical protein
VYRLSRGFQKRTTLLAGDSAGTSVNHAERPQRRRAIATITRFGLSRQEILAEFEWNMVPFEVELR